MTILQKFKIWYQIQTYNPGKIANDAFRARSLQSIVHAHNSNFNAALIGDSRFQEMDVLLSNYPKIVDYSVVGTKLLDWICNFRKVLDPIMKSQNAPEVIIEDLCGNDFLEGSRPTEEIIYLKLMLRRLLHEAYPNAKILTLELCPLGVAGLPQLFKTNLRILPYNASIAPQIGENLIKINDILAPANVMLDEFCLPDKIHWTESAWTSAVYPRIQGKCASLGIIV